MSDTIVFIYDEPGYMVQTIIHNIEEAGMKVISINADLTEIERNQYASDIIIYYLGNVEMDSRKVLKCLNGMCREYRKTLCIIGEANSLKRAQETCGTREERASSLWTTIWISSRSPIPGLTGSITWIS